MLLHPMLLLALVLMGALATQYAIIVFLKRFMRRRRNVVGRRCTCGYLLVGLTVPRCPECGRMIGFDKTPEELGLTEQELRDSKKPK